jgi:hypothetical protein
MKILSKIYKMKVIIKILSNLRKLQMNKITQFRNKNSKIRIKKLIEVKLLEEIRKSYQDFLKMPLKQFRLKLEKTSKD